ncbi:MAG: protein kinase [Candidatus Wallbacteria bacterium]
MSNSKYKIVKKLGQGGMGTVYLGHDQILDRPVAIKVLSSELSSNSEFTERFLTEARVCAKLNHPNIIKIFDFGKSPSTNQIYFVMEYIDGESLTNLIKFNKIETEKKLITICIDVLNGLKCSHEQGILHRDIKPDNILLNKSGNPILMDFGIAKLIQNEGMTRTGETMGTPEYMSPEQVMGSELNCQTDLYSFGIVMYQMTTGKLPFQGDTPIATALKHVHDTPLSPSQFNKSISQGLEKIILKVIQKDKNLRYQTATEIINDLYMLTDQNIEIKVSGNEVGPIKTNRISINTSQTNVSPKQLTQNIETSAINFNQSKISINDIILKSIEDGKLNFHEILFDAITDNDVETFNFLTALKLPLNFINKNNSTPLMHAIKSNSQDMIDLMLSYKIDVNFKNNFNETPLMIACNTGDLETVKLLLKKGANPDLKNNKNELALNYSENKGYSEISNFLLNFSSSISEPDEIDTHTNDIKIQNGNLSLDEILLENISSNNFNPNYELFQAIENDQIFITNIIIKLKLADVNIKDKKSNTPLHHAAKYNNKSIITSLINNGANCNITNINDETPLHIACNNGNIDIISILLEKTDYTIKNSNSKDILDIAKDKGNKDIIKLIENHIKAKSPSLINKFMGIFKR